MTDDEINPHDYLLEALDEDNWDDDDWFDDWYDDDEYQED